MSVVAHALECGDIAKAQVATLLLQFPDPAALTKEAGSGDDLHRLAGELAATSNPRRAWPSAEISKEIRRWVAEAAGELMASGEERLIFALPVADAIGAFVEALGLGELNTGEQRILDQLYANFDAPKTFQDLRTPQTDNGLGYEQHHIVGQNPDNVAKQELMVPPILEKFGRDKIDDPDNIAWIPRLKHEQITAYYNSVDDQDPEGRVRWRVINDMDFAEQQATGLAILREFGVLQ